MDEGKERERKECNDGKASQPVLYVCKSLRVSQLQLVLRIPHTSLSMSPWDPHWGETNEKTNEGRESVIQAAFVCAQCAQGGGLSPG